MRENVLVQVRTGALTHEDFGAIASHARRVAAGIKGNFAFIGVIESDAATVEPEVRAKQKELITQMVERLDVRMGVVILGDDIGATMRRTMARMMIPGHGRLRVVAKVTEACSFIEPHAGMSAASIEELVHEARGAASATTRG